MNSGSRASNSPVWDWRSWMPGPRNVSGSFTEPILPGWNFGSVYNVTTYNSTAPETEAKIVTAHSYGRQIGRIMDALELVIAELPREKQAAIAIRKFNELHGEIDNIKARELVKQYDNVESDLASLQKQNPIEYNRVVASLRDALRSSTRTT